jgi:wyosine [tRNA(Phe)-imidazoG37] synthetase (radical SAM superfamily)
MNCIYCEVGRTTRLTVRRKEYVPADRVLEEVHSLLPQIGDVDYITFAGSGEPTLHSRIGELILRIKEMTGKPTAVLTNGSLLTDPQVRQELLPSDLVLPSLDAATQGVFKLVNRPHGTLDIQNIIDGLVAFREAYRGLLWLEIMLIRGVNDGPGELKRLREAVARIRPDSVQLNTAVRPPAEPYAGALSDEELEQICRIFGEKCESIATRKATPASRSATDTERTILALTARRPVTLEEMSESIGINWKELLKEIAQLMSDGKISVRTHNKRRFYVSPSRGDTDSATGGEHWIT